MTKSVDVNPTERGAQQDRFDSLMAIFEKLRGLSRDEITCFFQKENIDPTLQNKLIKMLSMSEVSESVIDTPLTERIATCFDQYSKSLVGQTINGYRLEELLNCGSLTSVYKASQQYPISRNVALKIIHPDASKDSSDFFRHESRALAKLSHPNIATIHTTERDERGLPFIIMEYIQGLPLVTYCDQKKMTIDQRLRLFLQVCDSIIHSHSRGILHRDIKSTNILVSEYKAGLAVPKVIDFGISSAIGRASEGAETPVMGTPEYMSPEHIIDDSEVDIRSDVYSLGMLLFHLLVGKIPFNRHLFIHSDNESRKQMVVDFKPLAPSMHLAAMCPKEQQRIADDHSFIGAKYRQAISPELDWIYSRATAKMPAQRYQSVAELADDIQRHQKNEVVHAKSVSLFYRLIKLIQRHALIVAVGAVGCLSISIFMSAIIRQNQQIKVALERVENERDLTHQVFEVLSTFLETTNPWVTGAAGDMTVEAMLEQSIQRFTQNHGMRPEVKYALFLKLVETYMNMGMPEKAKLINNLVLEREDFPNPLMDIEANINASYLLRLLPDNKGQLRFALRAQQLCAQHNVNGPLLIRALRRLGNAYYTLGALDQAKESLERALTEYEREVNEEQPLKGDIVLDLANVTYWLNDYALAELLYKEALRINRVFFNEEHARVVKTKIHLAELWRIVGRYKEAMPVIENSYAIQRKFLGDHHIDVLKTQGELVRVYRYSREFDKAEALVLDLIPKLVSVFGESEDETVIFNLELAQVYKGLGRFEEAVVVAKRAHSQAQSNIARLGDHLEPVLGYADKILANVLSFDGKQEEALNHINQAVSFFSNPETFNDFYIADSLMIRAGIYIELGDFETAEQDALQTIEVFSRMLGQTNERVLMATTLLSYARLRQKETPENHGIMSSNHQTLTQKFPKNMVEMVRIERWMTCMGEAAPNKFACDG